MDKFNYLCTYAYVRGTGALRSAREKIRERVDEIRNDESGMEVIAVILILVIVVALILIFKKQIMDLVEKVWNSINNGAGKILDDNENNPSINPIPTKDNPPT